MLRCSQMYSDDHRCFWIFSRYSIDVLLMFSRCSLDVPRKIAGFFQDDHFEWKIQRNSMIPNYSMIPAIRWSPAIQWSIGSMDFDNPKIYGSGGRYPIWFNSMFEFCQKMIHSIFDSYCFTQDSIQNIIQFQKQSTDSIQKMIQFNSQGIMDTGWKGKGPKIAQKVSKIDKKRGLLV